MPGKLPRLWRRPSGKHRTPRRECAPGRGRDPEAAASIQRTLLVSVPQWLFVALTYFRCLLFDIREPKRSCRGAFKELAVRLDAGRQNEALDCLGKAFVVVGNRGHIGLRLDLIRGVAHGDAEP